MKGIILAGGQGTRLLPMTRVTNKHLLPVYDRPMVYYPLQQMAHCGIREILLVTGGNNPGDFLRLLGNGQDFGLEYLGYTYQEGHGGIAAALGLASNFADGEPVMVLLGDNLFQDSLIDAVKAFDEQTAGAMVLLKEAVDPERFGVPELDGDRIVGIEEKPTTPSSPYAVTGCYFFDHRVFEIIESLEPSDRGELEITDVNNHYIGLGQMRYRILDGWWTDAGTVESLYRAHQLVADDSKNPVLHPSHVPTSEKL